MISTKYKLTAQVSGRTWSGFFDEVEYKLAPSQVDDYKTLDDFKEIAGDFETISHVELIWAKITTKYVIKSFD